MSNPGYATVVAITLLLPNLADSQEEHVIATSNGVDVLFVPDVEPLLGGELVGGTLRLRSAPDTTFVTFDNISFEALHHVGVPSIFGGSIPTLRISDHLDPIHPLYDSHLLITPNMIGGSAGAPMTETGANDPTAFDPAGVQDRIPSDSFGFPAHPYLGDIRSVSTSAFFLNGDSRGNTIDFARLVGPLGYDSHIELGVLGLGLEPTFFSFDLAWGTNHWIRPTVEMSAVENETILRGTTVSLQAEATHADLVEFFANGQPIPDCSFSMTPYRCEWTPVVGDYDVSVRASNRIGFAESAIRQVSVLSPPPPPPEFLVASTNGVDVFFVPDVESLLDGDLMGGTLKLRSSEDSNLATLSDLSLEGLHHVAVPRTFVGPEPAVRVSDHHDPTHQLLDSHLLITPEMIGGAVGEPIVESGVNDADAFDPAGIQDRIPADAFGNLAHPYRGDIRSNNGAFFLSSSFQSNDVDIARLVGQSGHGSHIELKVLGEGITSAFLNFDLNWGEPMGEPPNVSLEVSRDETTATFTAIASDSDGEVRLVQFYNNGLPIDDCRFTSGPYDCSLRVEGQLEITARATDDLGFSSYSERISAGVPTVSLRYPSQDISIHFGAMMVLDAEAKNADNVEFLANGQLIPDCSFTIAPYRCEWLPPTGQNEVVVRATNDYGTIDSSPHQVGVGPPPLIRFVTPAHDLWGSAAMDAGETITLTAESDRATMVEFLANNQVIPGCSFTGAPFECEWSPTLGTYELFVRATDADGNTQSNVRQVSVLDPLLNSPPVVSLRVPQLDRTILMGDTIRLSATANDDDGVVDVVEFMADDEPVRNCRLTEVPYSCDWTPDIGVYSISVVATDDDGASRSAGNRTVIVLSPTGPTVAVTSPSLNRGLRVGENIQLSAIASDDFGAVEVVEFSANNEPIPNCRLTEAPYTCDWTPEVGEYLISVLAIDDDGFERVANGHTVTVFTDAGGLLVGGLPTDENGNPIVEEVVDHGPAPDCVSCDPGLDAGSPRLTQGHASIPTYLTFQSAGLVTLVSVNELIDGADMFSYDGPPPPIRFELQSRVTVGPFTVNPIRAGEHLATYELLFDDGTRILANIDAIVLPVPEPNSSSLFALVIVGVAWKRRKKVGFHGFDH